MLAKTTTHARKSLAVLNVVWHECGRGRDFVPDSLGLPPPFTYSQTLPSPTLQAASETKEIVNDGANGETKDPHVGQVVSHATPSGGAASETPQVWTTPTRTHIAALPRPLSPLPKRIYSDAYIGSDHASPEE